MANDFHNHNFGGCISGFDIDVPKERNRTSKASTCQTLLCNCKFRTFHYFIIQYCNCKSRQFQYLFVDNIPFPSQTVGGQCYFPPSQRVGEQCFFPLAYAWQIPFWWYWNTLLKIYYSIWLRYSTEFINVSHAAHSMCITNFRVCVKMFSLNAKFE